MKEFYLPYNFVPVTGKIINTSNRQDRKQERRPRVKYDYAGETKRSDQEGAERASAKALARHDLWQTGCRSGTFTCQLCIITPTVVGNEHKGNDPTEVCQYTWNGKPAIPANSLRGMISSLAETLSQSSLRVLDSKFHPAFANIDPDLVPWNEQRERNSGLTPAELLFGVVENNKKSDEDDRSNGAQDEHTHNLASRVRFYDAVLAAGEEPESVLDDPVVLQVLASPKPEGYPDEDNEHNEIDRPSLYFRRSQIDPSITYRDLREYVKSPSLPHPLPHGRKFYLLHEKMDRLDRTKYAEKIKDGQGEPETKNRMECQPIKPSTQFEFSVAFDNLSDAELTLLKTALMPASETEAEFYHRLGLGKPLGLGIIRIEIKSIEYIDRKQRYSVDGLLKGGEKKAVEELSDDPSLIDKDTLIQVRKAGSLKALRAGVSVRWRKGYLKKEKKEEAAPLPLLNPAEEFLPDFYELRQSVIASGSKPKVCGEQTSSNFIVYVGEEQTKAVKWLKEKICEMHNIPFDQLTEEKLEESIVGPALSKLWDKIADQGRKTTVRELILAAAEKRKWAYRWKSGGSKRAKKKYDAWS